MVFMQIKTCDEDVLQSLHSAESSSYYDLQQTNLVPPEEKEFQDAPQLRASGATSRTEEQNRSQFQPQTRVQQHARVCNKRF